LQEDYRFSHNRKNSSQEAQKNIRVQHSETQENSQFFPLRKSRVLQFAWKTNPSPRVRCKKGAPLPVLKPKRISQTGSKASQISSQRTNLSTNFSTCLPNVPEQPAMHQIPVENLSTPLIRGVEEFSFPVLEDSNLFQMMEHDTQSPSSTPFTMGVENFPSTGKSLCREFNTPTSTLNTPDIKDLKFEEIFMDFFSRNDSGNEAMKTNEASIDESVAIEIDFSQPEEIWGYKTFNDDDAEFGVCAPPSMVEGAEEDSTAEDVLFTFEAPVQHVAEEAPEPTFNIETNDVLQWIIDDQQIGDLPIFEECKSEIIHTIKPDENISEPVKVEVKTEDIPEDEKYRKMRIQNNEASRKCRLNRKRKLQDMEEECKVLEDRNVFLKSQLEQMEQEVKVWKRKLLLDIKNTSAQMSQF